MGAPTLVIANPASRGGAWRARWPALERALRSELGSLEVRFTRGRDDVAQAVRAGVQAGAKLVVVAGGDGTASQTASALLAAGLGDRAELAVLPLGTGRDFARTLGVPHDPGRAAAAVAGAPTATIDVGRVSFQAAAGCATTHFVNVASAGLSGRVTAYIDRQLDWAKRWSGSLAFFAASLRCLWGWRAIPVALFADGECVLEAPVEVVAIANGTCFGGGMEIAPDARLDDGRFDIVAIRATHRVRLLAQITPALYRGRHLGLSGVTHLRAARVELRASGKTTRARAPAIPLEADGESLGYLPARFEVIPGALRVRCPRR